MTLITKPEVLLVTNVKICKLSYHYCLQMFVNISS